MADGETAIVLSPQPFGPVTHHLTQPAGRTVAQVLVEAVRQGLIDTDDLSRTALYVDGVRIPRDQALDLVLREGQVVNLQVEVLGGGGGRKEIGQILMTIAVIAVSAWIGAGAGDLIANSMMAQVAAATVLTLGQAAVSALFAPDRQHRAVNDRYALQNASNDYRPWQPFPIALGEVHVAPDMAVKTFTQARGDDVWLYGILALHLGPCEVEDLKIGDTLVSSMGAGDVQIVEHLTPGPRTFSLYPNDTDQLDLQEKLQATVGSSTPVTRAASSDGERFEFDFFLPSGLHFQKDDGRLLAAQVTVTIRYRPVDADGQPTGEGAWQSGLTIPLSSTTTEPMRVTRSLSLPLGRYEFEVRRSSPPDSNSKRRDEIAWTAVRAVAYRKPITDETLSIIEFAVRATALNQGTLAPFTCRIRPLIETWTGSGWSGALSASSNPAALTRWLMTGPAPARPLTSDQADAGLREWSLLCDDNDWTAHIYLKEARQQAQVLAMLEQAGRAGVFWDGVQIVASPWCEKPAPVQMFTGDNLADHRWRILYSEPIHGYRVEFANLDEAGAPDELYVYNDGYGETDDPANGIVAASLIEALRLEGQRTAERAYRDGRWELARRLHQRRVDTWTTDAEHLVSRYGDRVRLAWARVDGGVSARVRCRRWSGGLVTGLRLSQAVTFEAGLTYAADLRFDGQVLAGVPLQNPASAGKVQTREVRFATPRAPADCPARGDLIAFGEPTRISEDVELIGIAPAEGLKATLTGIRYVAPLLMAAETGPIPPLQTRLTRDREADPPTPRLQGVQIDSLGIRVGFAMPTWRGSPITGFVCRWRPRPLEGEASGWGELPTLGATAMMLVTPPLREFPIEGLEVTAVEIEIRAQTASGRISPALLVQIEDPALTAPSPGDWVWSVREPAADGSNQPALLVKGTARALKAREVVIEYIPWPPAGAGDDAPAAPDADADWIKAYQGPPASTAFEVTGIEASKTYYGAVHYRSEQGVSGPRTIWGPYKVGALVAGDSGGWGGRPSTDFVAIINNLNRLLTQIQQGANDQEARLRRHIDGVLGRVQIIAGVDPVAGSGVFHLQNLTAIDGLTLLETFDGLFVADEAAMAAVALEQYGRIAGDAAEAGARLAAITDLEGQIAYSGLELRNYVDAEIVSATAGLATLTYVDDTVALSALNLRSDITAEIASSTAGLVSSATLASNMALAALDAQARVDAYASTASGLFATTAAFNGLSSTVGVHATAIAGLQARAYLDLVADASGGLPALVRLMSGDGLSEVALIAARLIFGTTDGSTVVEAMRIIAGVVTILNRLNIGDENFFIDAPTKTIQAVVDDARLVFGAPFGVDRRVLWFGDKTIALSAMSAANSQFGMGGNVVVTLPPGTGTGGNGSFSGEAALSGALSGSGWQTAKSFTLNSVRAGSISVAVSTVGSETVGGANWTGQVRLREAGGAVVAGPEGIVVANLTEDPASTASFVGTVSAGGTVTYELQFSKSSGADVTALRGGVAVTTTPLLT